jgi:phosphoserine phosphatase RsbX
VILRSVDSLTRPRTGEQACGDAVVVRREERHSLLAVIDALGHGVRAAEAATRAVDVLGRTSLEAGVLAIIDELDKALHGSRGACALVCVLSGGKLEGCSVGNVELRSSGMTVPFLLTPGVLGARVRRPRVFVATASRRARLVAYSDGVSSRFHLDEFSPLSTEEACRAIFERHRRAHDDASLLVADVDAAVGAD